MENPGMSRLEELIKFLETVSEESFGCEAAPNVRNIDRANARFGSLGEGREAATCQVNTVPGREVSSS